MKRKRRVDPDKAGVPLAKRLKETPQQLAIVKDDEALVGFILRHYPPVFLKTRPAAVLPIGDPRFLLVRDKDTRTLTKEQLHEQVQLIVAVMKATTPAARERVLLDAWHTQLLNVSFAKIHTLEKKHAVVQQLCRDDTFWQAWVEINYAKKKIAPRVENWRDEARRLKFATMAYDASDSWPTLSAMVRTFTRR